MISDVDDLVFDPTAFRWIDSPDFNDHVRAAFYQEEMHRFQATLKASHAVIASTDYLAEQAESFVKSSWVHRNAFSLEMLLVSQLAIKNVPTNPEKVIVGYASGTPTHDRDFEVAKPALKIILQRYPQAELWTLGPLNPGKDWGLVADRIKSHKFVPWRELPGILSQFQINIAPLVKGNPFGQSKSEIKYMEAGLVKVPTVASPTEAYKYAIRSGENGYLANSEQEWIDLLSRLIEDEGFRRVMGDGAYTDVVEKYHPWVRAKELVSVLNQILDQNKTQLLVSIDIPRQLKEEKFHSLSFDAIPRDTWICSEVERGPSLSQMALYTLRHRGFITLLKQLWVFIRRALVPIWPYKNR